MRKLLGRKDKRKSQAAHSDHTLDPKNQVQPNVNTGNSNNNNTASNNSAVDPFLNHKTQQTSQHQTSKPPSFRISPEKIISQPLLASQSANGSTHALIESETFNFSDSNSIYEPSIHQSPLHTARALQNQSSSSNLSASAQNFSPPPLHSTQNLRQTSSQSSLKQDPSHSTNSLPRADFDHVSQQESVSHSDEATFARAGEKKSPQKMASSADTGRSTIAKNALAKSSISSLQSQLTHDTQQNHHYQQQQFHKKQYTISSLVDPAWDKHIIKTGWINKVNLNASNPDERLKMFRAELRGSTFSLYKAPADLNFVKYIETRKPVESDVLSAKDLIPDSDLHHSSLDLSSVSENETAELSKEQNNSIPKSESTKFSEALDDMQFFTDSTSVYDIQSIYSTARDTDKLKSQAISPKQASQCNKRTPFIVHELFYTSPSCPHPKLVFETATGMILSGTLESLCHTIAFYPSDKLASKLIEILPLIGSILDPLVYFLRFIEIFGSSTELKKRNAHITEMESDLMIQRIIRTIELITENFQGMLLEDDIFELIIKIINALENITDISQLRLLVNDKRNKLLNLTSFQDGKNIQPLSTLSAKEFIAMDLDKLIVEINSLDHLFLDTWDPRTDRSLSLSTTDNEFAYWKKNPLNFDCLKNIHYLGRLMSYHLFEDPVYSKSSELRGEILMKWIQLGTLLCESGNMVSWLGISNLVCSLPFLRLSKTWSHVDPELISLVSKSWAPVIFEIHKKDFFDVNEQSNCRILVPNGLGQIYSKEDVVPYYGDLFFNVGIIKEKEFIKDYCKYFEKVDLSLKKWDQFYSEVENKANLDNIVYSNLSSTLALKLKNAINFNSSDGPLSLQYVMHLSLETEKPYNGQFSRFHHSSRSPLFLGSYASILFPNILNYYQIYDRELLIGAIGGSEMIENVQNTQSQLMNNTNATRKPVAKKNRNVFLKHVRDLLNIDSFEFQSSDSSIIFKTIDFGNSNNTDSKIRSRPSSVLFSENLNSLNRISTVSTSSIDLDDYISTYHNYLRDSIEAQQSSNKKDIMGNLKEGISNSTESSLLSGRVFILTKAATIERLIDLLVLTSSIFGTRINQSDIAKYLEKNSSAQSPVVFQMDNFVFTKTFFSTYRGFCSTKELISALKRRFMGSKSASISIAANIDSAGNKNHHDQLEFPNWDKIYDEDVLNGVNWKFVAQIQLGVLEATLQLVEHHFKHFVDDISTKEAFDEFLESLDHEIVVEWPQVVKWLESNKIDDLEYFGQVMEVYDELQILYKETRNIYIKNSYTPQTDILELIFTDELSDIPNECLLPSYNDVNSIVDFVSRMDETISSIMSTITVDDWIDSFEILQLLTTKSPLDMFYYDAQKLGTHEDLLIISSIFHWILTLTEEKKEANQNVVYIVEKFPMSVKSILQIYLKFKNYLTLQVVDTSYLYEERVKKMATMLEMLQICRIKMEDVKLFGDPASDSKISPYVPSMIESLIINTILSPESRFFSDAWVEASKLLGVEAKENYNELFDILPPKEMFVDYAGNEGQLTPCPGWVLQRLVEISCFVPNMDIKNTTLINFDKNRFAYNCIVNIQNMMSRNSHKVPYDTEFGFLFEFRTHEINLKDVYNHSVMERKARGVKNVNIFYRHIEEQIQLMKLEHTKRELLLKQREEKINNANKAISMLGNRMANVTLPLDADCEPKSSDISLRSTSTLVQSTTSDMKSVSNSQQSSSSLQKQKYQIQNQNQTQNQNQNQHQHQNQNQIQSQSQSQSQSHNHHHSNRTSKAASQSSLVQSSASQNRFKFGFLKSRPFSININNFNQPAPQRRPVKIEELPPAENYLENTTKNKPYMILQLKDYPIFPTYRTPFSFTIDVSSSVNSSNAEYTLQAVNEDEKEDWIYKLNYSKKHWFFSTSLNKHFANNNINLTFGAPIEFVCLRDNASIPIIIEKILSEIEFRGLEEVGIYRKSSSLTVVQQIKDEINKVGDFNMENSLVFDVHNLTGCIKAYLRELPDPIINDELIEEFDKIKELAHNDARFETYRQIFSKLSIFNFNLVERLSRHMKLIVEYQAQNKMTSYNLATIMGGSFIEGCKPENMKKCFGLINYVCEDLITKYDIIFEN